MTGFVKRFLRYHSVGFSIPESLRYAWLVSVNAQHAARLLPH